MVPHALPTHNSAAKTKAISKFRRVGMWGIEWMVFWRPKDTIGYREGHKKDYKERIRQLL